MLETLIELRFALRRHQEAPLLKEREEFLSHLYRQGTSREALVTLASLLIHVNRLLGLKTLRDVEVSEIRTAAAEWARRRPSHPSRKTGPYSATYFSYCARKWLRFCGKLRTPPRAPVPFASELKDFSTSLAVEQGLSPHSVRSHYWKSRQFLAWFSERGRSMSGVSLDHVDEFLSYKGANGWSRVSVAVAAQALRSFFRHAARRGWCPPGIARGIRGPMIYRNEGLSGGPTWDEVRQVLRSVRGKSRSDLRARAILMLLSVYGLRSGEIVGLELNDFDWVQETFSVRRSKRSGTQQYPLRREVGDSILEYLKGARPRCANRSLFLTLNPPHRSVNPSSLWTITSRRFNKLDVRCRRRGPHTFRHACATRLLQKGVTFKEIGDFLGHRNSSSVEIYAKVDVTTLRKVAEVRLGGLL